LTIVLGLAALAAAVVSGDSLSWQWAIDIALVLAVLVGLAGAPRRFANLVVRPDGPAWAELARVARDPLRLVGLVGSASAIALLDALVLVAVTRATGSSVALAPVLFVSLLVAALAVIAPTPAGAGVVEAATAVGLVWAGLSAPSAVVAAVLARVVSFWLPLLPGWIATRRLVAAGAL
jgi:undecaprenyl-diphosphatase